MPGRILVIRGGALGDFLLTLPALRLLREGLPAAQIEILGYRQIIALADGRFYASATRSIEYGPLAGFFSRQADLSPELVEYFSSFSLVLSYLFDPDGLFAGNLARAGVKDLLVGPGKIQPQAHATAQLAAPLASLALYLENDHLQIFPTAEDHEKASRWINEQPCRPTLALHPGSGGLRKNWAIENWIALIERLLALRPQAGLAIMGGEADAASIAAIGARFAGEERLSFLTHAPLPHVGAVLSQIGTFLGHDSGITHLAAAAGCRGLALFGPTDPAVWAPPNPGISVLQAPNGDLEALDVDTVWAALEGSAL
jgi:heptosyltransferase-3